MVACRDGLDIPGMITAMTKTTVRLTPDEYFAAAELRTRLGRRCGRRLDFNEISRALWRLADEDPGAQDALVRRLRGSPGSRTASR
jgi:hypothetical protein